MTEINGFVCDHCQRLIENPSDEIHTQIIRCRADHLLGEIDISIAAVVKTNTGQVSAPGEKHIHARCAFEIIRADFQRKGIIEGMAGGDDAEAS
ncbi:hypothetical protein M0R72_06335 [Candidatus Pacearchaeota archaeon]|jgi:hypothetical protein|nr:hypothetical protein [Candidatus Pacearchaeota archaeon]